MEKDIFLDALETLDDLGAVATSFRSGDSLQLDDSGKARLFRDVVRLRELVIGTTKCTESERTRVVNAASQEGMAARSLSSLQSRIDVLNEKTQETQAMLEDQTNRRKLEQANENLAIAKKRVASKREIYGQREKALANFRAELGPSFKLGTLFSVSEFDDAKRVDASFQKLPRPLQFLYGQLRTVKKLHHLPMEITITSKNRFKTSSDGIFVDTSSLHGKKQRSSEKKMKYGPGEKRRKRWYESIIGKESAFHEEWMLHQRSKHIHHLLVTHTRANIQAHGKKYALLMKLLDCSDKQQTTKRKSKSKKNRKKAHTVTTPFYSGDVATSSLFSLPVPEGELCVEVRFLDRDVEITTLIFSFYSEKIFVSSSPDWFLAKTIQSQGNPLPISSTSFIANYGYPVNWAQDIGGVDLLKEQISDVEEMKTLNKAMIQQHQQLANLMMHVRDQALDLRNFKAGLVSVKNRVAEGSKKDSDKARIVQFRQIPVETIKKAHHEQRNQNLRIQKETASGWWTVFTQKTKKPTQEVHQPGEKSTTTRVRFIPHQASKKMLQKLGIEKKEYYYESLSPASMQALTLEASERIKMNASELPVVLSGPVSSADLSKLEESMVKENLISGRLVVQKKARIPKKYSGVLPMDYRKRFFPFQLHQKRRSLSVEMTIPDGQEHLYRVYRMMVQKAHIQLSVLYQVHLMKPLMPIVTVEGIIASSDLSRKMVGEGGKELKERSNGVDSKRSGDHVKIEREKILRFEGEALKIRNSYDQIANALEKLPHEKGKTRQKQIPDFHCEEGKRWMTLKVRNLPLHSFPPVECFQLSSLERMSPEDCVKRLEDLLRQWCDEYFTGIKALNEFMETSVRGKKKEIIKKRPTKAPKEETRRENRASIEGKTPVHDEELEQGEIPSISIKRSSSRRREKGSDTSRTRDRQRSRSPNRHRPSDANEGREIIDHSRRIASQRMHVSSVPRTPAGIGAMRMDMDAASERRSHSANRMRRN